MTPTDRHLTYCQLSAQRESAERIQGRLYSDRLDAEDAGFTPDEIEMFEHLMARAEFYKDTARRALAR